MFKLGPRFRKVSATRIDPQALGPVQLRAGTEARVPDSRPSVPQAPETTRGRREREGPSNQRATHPRSRKRRLRDSLEGPGARSSSSQRQPRSPPPAALRGPREKCPQARGVTVARRPGEPLPLPAWGPEGLSLQRRGEGGREKGALASQPGTSRTASRPQPRPQRASGTHARTQKVKSGASPARRRRGPAPGSLPPPRPGLHGPSAPPAAAPSRPPAARGAPRPTLPALTQPGPFAGPRLPSAQHLTPPAAPDIALHLHTHPPALPESCLPSPSSYPPRFH